MPNITGSFSGKTSVQTLISLGDQPNHDLQVAEITGQQKSSDPEWNNARMRYWGVTDLQSGNGTQRGYWINEHTSGDRDWGSFEGTVTTSGNAVTIEGIFTFTGGSGKLSGITGGGTYRGRMTSPTQVEMDWRGAYQIAGTKATGAA